MIKIIPCIFAILLTMNSLNAQYYNGRSPRQMKEDALLLKLSKEQATKMDALKAEWKRETSAINNDKSLSRVEKKVKINELKEVYRPRRDAIYTPEQREILPYYDTGIFGYSNMDRNARWNEKAMAREKAGDARQVEQDNMAPGRTEKQTRKPAPSKPEDHRAKKETIQADETDGDAAATEAVKTGKRRRPGPPRPGDRRTKKETIQADETDSDEANATEAVKTEKRRRPGPPRPGDRRTKKQAIQDADAAKDSTINKDER